MRTLLAALPLTLVAPALAAAQVVITEVQPNPPSGFGDAEWVEIQNVGTASVSIADWTLSDYSGSMESATRWAFPADASLAAGQVIVVAKQTTPAGFFEAFLVRPTYELGVPSDDPMTPDLRPSSGRSFGLNNTDDAVLLRDRAGALVDGVEWGATDRNVPGAPKADVPDRGESLVRVGRTGSSDSDFMVSATPTPFVGNSARAAPVIGSVRHAPAHVAFPDALTVTASIVDSDGLRLAEVALSVASASVGAALQDYVRMALTATRADGYVFSAPVGNLAAGLGFGDPADFHSRYVRYFLRAEDTTTATSTEPPLANESAGNTAYRQLNVMPSSPTSIALAREQDAGGRIRWPGHSVRVRGVALVGSGTFNARRTQLALYDGNSAIQAYHATPTVPVAAGDDIEVSGTIGQFYGLAQLSTPAIRVLASGAAIPERTLTIAQILLEPERFESELIRIRDADFVQPTAEWSKEGGEGTNVEITDGTGMLTVRVWHGTSLHRVAAPTSGFHIRGVLGQRSPTGRDGTQDGYQLWPRGIDDVEAKQAPDAGVSEDASGLADAGTEKDASGSADVGGAPKDGSLSLDAQGNADAAARMDGSVPARQDSGLKTGARDDAATTGCSCRASGANAAAPSWLWLLGMLGLLYARRSARRR